MNMIKIKDGTDYFELLDRIDAERIMLADQLWMISYDKRFYTLRHDVDRKIENGMLLAEAEYERGIRSTFFLLHSSAYFDYSDFFLNCCRSLERMGHKIELHNDALGEWHKRKEAGEPENQIASPRVILRKPLDWLRGHGFNIIGSAAHGNKLCGKYGFNNYHIFSDWPKPESNKIDHQQFPMADLGLEYEVYHLPEVAGFSDGGGHWRGGVKKIACPYEWGWSHRKWPPEMRDDRRALRDAVIETFNKIPAGVLHILIHPNWWRYDQ